MRIDEEASSDRAAKAEEVLRSVAVSYDYPPSEGYADTVATMRDGRVMHVNTQYSCVLPHGEHAAECDQLNKMGGRCTCGLLDGIDVAALVADARVRGKRGRRPTPPPDMREANTKRLADLATRDEHQHDWCDKCKSYCYGDCEASR